MPRTIDEISKRIGALTVGGDASSPQPSAAQKELVKANLQLELLVHSSTTQPRQARSVTSSFQNCNAECVASLKSLRTNANALETAARVLSHATEHYIVAHISSMTSRRTANVTRLLEHYKEEIRDIVKAGLDKDIDDSTTLCSIIQECFDQSVVRFGTLHSDNYSDTLEDTHLESPYDLDFESEEYYDHDNRLEVDEDYAEGERQRQKLRSERRRAQRRTTHQEWTIYWLDALHRCQGGPTLFWPPATREFENHFESIPQYLFRVFDSKSSGRNDLEVIESIASVDNDLEVSDCKRDILSLDQKEATENLLDHFNKSAFSGYATDNLMSWSSSLLFLIQYAIWRSQWMPPSEVFVCAIDTSKFSRGQFAQDMALIEACHDKDTENEKMKNFIRLRKSGYNNGEYVSQGRLDIRGRSCVTTLQALIDHGINELYPEFDDADGRKKWTNRVRDLRHCWDVACSTTSKEIKFTLRLASACFPEMKTIDMALHLLTFKNRMIEKTLTAMQRPPKNYEKFGPSEVQRYLKTKDTMESQNRGNMPLVGVLGAQLFKIQTLEEFFKLN